MLTHAPSTTRVPISTAARHLSLIRAFRWPSAAHTRAWSHTHVASFHRLITSLTGVEQLHVRVHTTGDVSEAAIPIALTSTWLSRCTRLHTLTWETHDTYDTIKRDDRQPHDAMQCIQQLQHTFAQLSHALTALHIYVRASWWSDGVYEHIIAALAPLSSLRITLSLSDSRLAHLPTYAALVRRHASTLHTLHVPTHIWSWTAWGELGKLTQLTELHVNMPRMLRMEEEDRPHVSAVTHAGVPRRTCMRVLTLLYCAHMYVCVCVLLLLLSQLSALRHLRRLELHNVRRYAASNSLPTHLLLTHLSPTLIHLTLISLPDFDDAALAHVLQPCHALQHLSIMSLAHITPHGIITACAHLTQLRHIETRMGNTDDEIQWTAEQVNPTQHQRCSALRMSGFHLVSLSILW